LPGALALSNNPNDLKSKTLIQNSVCVCVCEVLLAMALQEALGASSGELMQEDAITGGRMTRIFATLGV
jgi:hypothetical protein